ncbi:hypothetical protein ACQP3D_30175, partial [Escherichia coli]
VYGTIQKSRNIQYLKLFSLKHLEEGILSLPREKHYWACFPFQPPKPPMERAAWKGNWPWLLFPRAWLRFNKTEDLFIEFEM